jgi:hypothetical protein
MGVVATVAMCVLLGATSFSTAMASNSTITTVNPHTLYFATVVKVAGTARFNRMYCGEELFAKRAGVAVTQTAPPTSTAGGQVARPRWEFDDRISCGCVGDVGRLGQKARSGDSGRGEVVLLSVGTRVGIEVTRFVLRAVQPVGGAVYAVCLVGRSR